MFNKFDRYQQSLKLSDYAPNIPNKCACGCGKKLEGRKKRWATQECANNTYIKFAILKGNTGIIRKELFKIDKGYCRECGVYDPAWQADHIIPVAQGGGASSLYNFQTLCVNCHKKKTAYQMASHHNAISSQAAFSAFRLRTYDLGAEQNCL